MYRDNQLKINSSHEFFIFAKRTFEPSCNAQHALDRVSVNKQT